MKHDYLRIFGNKSFFDILLFGTILFLLAVIPSIIYSEKQVPMFLIGFYISLYVYFKIIIYFSNYESFRSISGGKWEYLSEYKFWRKLGYFEALESGETEEVSITTPENTVEQL